MTTDPQDRYRLRRLELRVEAIEKHFGLTPPAEDAAVSTAVRELILQGKLIQAIQLHREETGLGLAEAKAEVEKAAGS